MALKTFMFRGQTVYSPKYDKVFKAVFAGKDKTLLASLLTSILGMDIKAEDILINNSEVTVRRKKQKPIYLDINLTVANRYIVNMEMQVRNENNMGKRSLHSLSQLMGGQLETGEKYGTLCLVTAINFLDFNYIKNSKNYHTRFRMKETGSNIEMPDAEYFEIIFIELGKLPKTLGNSMKELWVKFLSVQTGEELEMLTKQKPVFETAANKLVSISATKEMRRAMDKADKWERDRLTERDNDRAKGEAKGEAKRAAETAKEMLANNEPTDKIVRYTKLTVKQIEKLRKEVQ